MVDINLLPWRVAQSQYKKRQVQRWLLMVIVFGCLWHGLPYVILTFENERLRVPLQDAQTAWQDWIHLEQEQQQTHSLHQERQSQAVLLRRYGESWMAIWHLISGDAITQVCFKQVSHANSQWHMVGYTRTDIHLAALLEYWRSSGLWRSLKIEWLRFAPNQQFIEFRIGAQEMNPLVSIKHDGHDFHRTRV